MLLRLRATSHLEKDLQRLQTVGNSVLKLTGRKLNLKSLGQKAYTRYHSTNGYSVLLHTMI